MEKFRLFARSLEPSTRRKCHGIVIGSDSNLEWHRGGKGKISIQLPAASLLHHPSTATHSVLSHLFSLLCSFTEPNEPGKSNQRWWQRAPERRALDISPMIFDFKIPSTDCRSRPPSEKIYKNLAFSSAPISYALIACSTLYNDNRTCRIGSPRSRTPSLLYLIVVLFSLHSKIIVISAFISYYILYRAAFVQQTDPASARKIINERRQHRSSRYGDWLCRSKKKNSTILFSLPLRLNVSHSSRPSRLRDCFQLYYMTHMWESTSKWRMDRRAKIIFQILPFL